MTFRMTQISSIDLRIGSEMSKTLYRAVLEVKDL